MGPQKSRGLYRPGAYRSNHQSAADPLVCSPSRADLRYHGAFA